MHAAFPFERQSPAPCRLEWPGARHGGLQIHEVLAHVAQRSAQLGATALLQRLMDVADACTRVVAARRSLTQALDVQQHIERLVDLAQGRERAKRMHAGEREALQPPLALAQAQATQALAAWRDAGQAFAQLTGLLSTQLPHGLAWPAALNALERQALERARARGDLRSPIELFERTLARHDAAQARCDETASVARSMHAARLKTVFDWRSGQGSLACVAQAWLADRQAQDAGFHAQADRASALCGLNVLSAGVVQALHRA